MVLNNFNSALPSEYVQFSHSMIPSDEIPMHTNAKQNNASSSLSFHMQFCKISVFKNHPTTFGFLPTV